MAWGLTQAAANAPGTGGVSTRAVTVSALGSGHLLVVYVMWNGTGVSSSAPTATGLTFAQVGTDVADGSNTKVAIWYCKDTTAGAGDTSVSANLSNTANFLDAYVLEFSGGDTTAPLRTSQSATGSSAKPITAALVTTAGDLIVGGATGTAVVSFKVNASTTGCVTDSTADGNGVGHKLSAGGTSDTPEFASTNAAWVMYAAAFIPAGGGGTTSHLMGMMGLGT